MDRTERTILTVLCMIYKDDQILLQNRQKSDWPGYTFPGGHIEKSESFVDAVKREILEETGLSIFQPHLCGIKQFPTDDGARYIVLLFKTDLFSGQLTSSAEGEMVWVNRKEISRYPLAEDFESLLQVFEEDTLTEFQYLRENDGSWKIKIQ